MYTQFIRTARMAKVNQILWRYHETDHATRPSRVFSNGNKWFCVCMCGLLHAVAADWNKIFHKREVFSFFLTHCGWDELKKNTSHVSPVLVDHIHHKDLKKIIFFRQCANFQRENILDAEKVRHRMVLMPFNMLDIDTSFDECVQASEIYPIYWRSLDRFYHGQNLVWHRGKYFR